MVGTLLTGLVMAVLEVALTGSVSPLARSGPVNIHSLHLLAVSHHQAAYEEDETGHFQQTLISQV